MNVLKHSGGHISGMSSSHHHNLNQQQNDRNFRGMASGSAGLSTNGTTNATGISGVQQQLKPLSSPRLQDQGVETNLAYQQQLQWKKGGSQPLGDEKTNVELAQRNSAF